jgi:hypothetical protein
MINGRRVDYGVDDAASKVATQRAQDLAIKRAEQQQGLDAGALDIDKKRVELAALQSTGGAKPLTESQGKAAGFGVPRVKKRLPTQSFARSAAMRRSSTPWVDQKVGRGGSVRWRRSRNADKLDAKRTAAKGRAGAAQFHQRCSSPRVWRGDYSRGVRQREKAVFPAARRRERDNCSEAGKPAGDNCALKTEGAHGYEQARAEFEARKAAISGGWRQTGARE